MHSQGNRLTNYSGLLSMFGAKVPIAALDEGLEFALVMVAYDSLCGYSPKHPEPLRVSPEGQVAMLVHGNLENFDSTRIFEYGKDPRRTPPRPTDIVAPRIRVDWNTSPMRSMSRTQFASWACRRI